VLTDKQRKALENFNYKCNMEGLDYAMDNWPLKVSELPEELVVLAAKMNSHYENFKAFEEKLWKEAAKLGYERQEY